jgi:hypothetical protein
LTMGQRRRRLSDGVTHDDRMNAAGFFSINSA